ncbi:hypothetical protein A0E43_08730 [Pectobacterium cacticida]
MPLSKVTVPIGQYDLFFAAWNRETFVEALNTTASINNTLLASIERVACATNVQVQVMAHS